MKARSVFTRVLIAVGSVLVWGPVLLLFVFASGSLLRSGRFRLDYLKAAALAFVCLAGGLLLIWAAIRVNTGRKLVIWSFAAALFFLVFSQLPAVWLGLASGWVGEGGWWMYMVVALMLLDVRGHPVLAFALQTGAAAMGNKKGLAAKPIPFFRLRWGFSPLGPAPGLPRALYFPSGCA